MKLKTKSKKFTALLLIFTFIVGILSFSSNIVIATANSNDFIGITPYWTNTSSISCNLTFSGKTATCTGNINGYSGATISGTLTLYKKNGSSWDYITSWDKSSTIASLNMSEKYTVNSAGTYKVILTGKVTRNGTTENVSITSSEKTCT